MRGSFANATQPVPVSARPPLEAAYVLLAALGLVLGVLNREVPASLCKRWNKRKGGALRYHKKLSALKSAVQMSAGYGPGLEI